MSRKNVFQLRLNDAEIELLKSRSAELGLSRSDYLRGLVELDSECLERGIHPKSMVEPKLVSSFKKYEGSQKKSTPTELGKGKGVGLSSDAIADMVKRQKDKKK